mmetsp:Transcript_9627/g.14918  ORF Transcript_9627/g.14918 Transcript_9627/m.14918 type:complete len:407 (+) Transcript_9627:456-1676(+)
MVRLFSLLSAVLVAVSANASNYDDVMEQTERSLRHKLLKLTRSSNGDNSNNNNSPEPSTGSIQTSKFYQYSNRPEAPKPESEPEPEPENLIRSAPVEEKTAHPSPTKHSEKNSSNPPKVLLKKNPVSVFDSLVSTKLVAGDNPKEDFRYGPEPQDALSDLPDFAIMGDDPETAFVYSVAGESDQTIDFAAVCGTHDAYGLSGAVRFYSKPKGQSTDSSIYLVAQAELECPGYIDPISVETLPEHDYLVVVYGFGQDARFELNVGFEKPREITTFETVTTNTADLGMIPTYYQDLDSCGPYGVDLMGLDTSAAYTVFGRGDESVDFTAACETDGRNEITILGYSRDARYHDKYGPTEGYMCRMFESIVCKRGNEKASFGFDREAGKQHLFVALARGTGDTISLKVHY